jgi:hypothetical protein
VVGHAGSAVSVRLEGLSVLAVPEPDGRIQPVIVSFAVRNTGDAATERALRTTVAVSPPPVSGAPAPIVTEELGPVAQSTSLRRC